MSLLFCLLNWRHTKESWICLTMYLQWEIGVSFTRKQHSILVCLSLSKKKSSGISSDMTVYIIEGTIWQIYACTENAIHVCAYYCRIFAGNWHRQKWWVGWRQDNWSWMAQWLRDYTLANNPWLQTDSNNLCWVLGPLCKCHLVQSWQISMEINSCHL